MSPTAKAPPQDPWRPDSRWALPFIMTVWIWTLGWAPVWAARWGDPFPVEFMIAAGLLVAGIGTWRARTVWTELVYGGSLREHGTLLAVLAGSAVGWWLWRAGYTSPWAQTPILLLIAAVLGVWWAALVTVAPRHAAAEAERGLRMEHMSEAQIMRQILDQSDMIDVKVIEHVETRAGYTTTLGPDPRFPNRPTMLDVTNKLSRLGLNLALYWRNRDGTELEGGDVRVEEISLDRWKLHVSTKHVLREVVPFTLTDTPQSFNYKIWIGLYEDGARMHFTLLGRHMWLIGVTGGGKSVIINNMIARILECRDETGSSDAIVWVCGADKVVPLVYPWLLPWFEGTVAEPPIDMIVGEDIGDVLRFLSNVYYLAKDRNTRNSRRSKITISSKNPAIVVFVEEAQMLLAQQGSIEMDNGELWSGGRLILSITAIARSAGISVILVTQSGMVDALGAMGSDILRNCQLRASTVTMTESDGRFVLPAMPAGVDTTMLKNHGMYMQVGIGEDSRPMPGKAAKLDEFDVPPVAATLAQRRRAHLPARDIEAFNHEEGYYENRWTAERLPVLVDAARYDEEANGGDGFTWPPDRASQVVVSDPLSLEKPGAAPADEPEPAEPVHTAPEPAPEPVDESLSDAEAAALDAELAKILGRPATVAPESPPKETPVTKILGDPISRLPGEEDIRNLERLAKLMQEQADEIIRQRDAEDAARPKAPPIVLPHPLGAVIEYLDGVADAPAWIPSRDLADVVFEPGEHDNPPLKLGQMLNRIGRAVGFDLRATEPRTLPDGSRARGFLVTDLYRAAVAFRDAQHKP